MLYNTIKNDSKKIIIILKKEKMMTKQRALILEILRSDMCHHTAEEIFELAKSKIPKISRATVYNNLHALEEEQIIRRISGDNGPDRYDNSYIPHGHLLCMNCGGVFDVVIPDFEANLSKHLGGAIDSYELKVKGVCNCCRAAAV